MVCSLTPSTRRVQARAAAKLATPRSTPREYPPTALTTTPTVVAWGVWRVGGGGDMSQNLNGSARVSSIRRNIGA